MAYRSDKTGESGHDDDDPRNGLRRAGEGLIRGRILWRDGDRAGLRTAEGDHIIEPAGDAQPGDLVAIAHAGARPEVARRHGGGAYPAPGCEVSRLPRPRLENLRARSRAIGAARAFFDR